MEYRRLGRTDLQVGVIGLGAEHLEQAPYETVAAVTHEALDHGVNYIDLFMGSPGVRDNFGRALRGRRDKVLIAGHLGATWQDGQYVKSRDAAVCESFFHDLLRRLGTDYIDLLMLHYVDEPEDCARCLDPGGLLGQALRLREQGKARAIGMSTHAASAAMQAAACGRIDLILFPVNPLFDLLPGDMDINALWEEESYTGLRQSGAPAGDRLELHHACARLGVGIVAMKPYAAGWLFKPGVAGEAGLTPVQCLSYALSQPGVCAAVPGCRSVEEMRAALAYLEAGGAERDYSVVARSPLWGPRGACLYCNHCLPCPAEIDIAAVMRLADAAGQVPTEELGSQYGALRAPASACTDCGLCRERCPFGVDPPAGMRRAASVFGR